MTRALLAAALFLFAGSAYAADMPLKAPAAAPPAPTWTGWYIGINGGGGWGRASQNAQDVGPDGFFALANVPAVVAGASQGINTSGGLAGGQVGFLYQTAPGQAIVGLEAGFDWSGLKGTAHNGPTAYPVTPASSFNWNLSAKSDSVFTVLGRIGPDLGMWFPYVTAGGAFSHLKYSANYVENFYPTNVTDSFSKDAAGWVIGAGAEVRFANHWMLRGEFLHMDFGTISGFGPIACNAPGVGNCAAGGNMTTFQFFSKTTENVGRVALSYKF
jgi:outer membrane immunogenic protein